MENDMLNRDWQFAAQGTKTYSAGAVILDVDAVNINLFRVQVCFIVIFCCLPPSSDLPLSKQLLQ
jgi:hypothetical protein